MKRFIQEQILDVDQEELWDFISTPSNLNSITPEWLDFRMVSEQVPSIYNGLLIEYEVRLPLLGRRKWVSEIKNVEPGRSFVDEQKVGPYRYWHHYHELQRVSETKTRMFDLVSYDVGWGPFGKLADQIYVKRNIRKIFTYRKEALKQLFSES
jgi:ligand-binding SRPBCC domain-containing protein